MILNWNTTEEDRNLITAIAHRAHQMSRRFGQRFEYALQDAIMDLTAVHANAYPLRLRELLVADEFNFAHDLLGIRRHLDRATGELGECFVPRFAWRQK